MYRKSLSADAALIREIYVKKSFPKANVAVIEVYLGDGTAFGMGATSRAASPAPLPPSKSQGGHFEPIIDPFTGRMMDTDAEYKALSAIASTLQSEYNSEISGKLYLYTEREPCESCQYVLKQFQQIFENIEVTLFWDYPYP